MKSSAPTAPNSPPVNEKTNKSKTPQMATIAPESGALMSAKHEIILRLQNALNGQLAILVEENDQQITAVPLNLYNKRGRVVLSFERSKTKSKTWGTTFGLWSAPDPNVMTSNEYPLGFGALVSSNKLFVSKAIYSRKSSLNQTNSVLLVRNQTKHLLFAAKEYRNLKVKFPFGRVKQIDFKFYDSFKREVVFCRQLLRSSSCLSSCCLQSMQVMGQPSKSIGGVQQKFTVFGVEFVVEDHKQNKLFRVKSTESSLRFKCKEYQILSMDNKEMGRIRPLLRNDPLIPAHEMPILCIEYKTDINPIHKTLLMSAPFLIKNLFYDI